MGAGAASLQESERYFERASGRDILERREVVLFREGKLRGKRREREREQRRFLRATGRDKKAERRGYRRELEREEERAFTEEAGTEERGCS